jgi:SAM-dependent methyltransferase
MIISGLGLDPRRTVNALRGSPFYLSHLIRLFFSAKHDWPVRFAPILSDRFEPAGSADGHYFHADLWAARRVHQGNFEKLVDVGSRIDGYVAHVLSFRSIEVFDVRKLESSEPGLVFRQVDLGDIERVPESYADCVSCLHALEHFGLGRYGDDFNLDGWLTGLRCLARMLKPGGTLLLAVPIGWQRIEFDAHRIFDPASVVAAASGLGLRLQQFSYVADDRKFYPARDVSAAANLDYGCGCFEFLLDGGPRPRPGEVRD